MTDDEKKLIIRLEQLEAFRQEIVSLLPKPVDVNSLTPSSTFAKNSIIGINGVLYQSLKQTSSMPVTVVTEGGKFVTQTVNGKTAFVVSDYTVNSDWKVYTDASIEYWVESIGERLDGKQDTISDIATIRQMATNAIKGDTTYKFGNAEYTADDLLLRMASLMNKVIVTKD